jgi:23S rRNA (pseudouridine1915-N3)-methyltransferase
LRVTILAIGRDRSGPARELFEDYRKRSSWPLELIEIAPQSRLPLARRRAAEGARLLAALPQGSLAVALDEHGPALDSKAFARRLAAWRDQGTAELAFLIGGGDGLDPAVLERAAATLALGPMTWPHRLVRVLLAEQLYRAQAILAGHPYHKAGPLD